MTTRRLCSMLLAILGIVSSVRGASVELVAPSEVVTDVPFRIEIVILNVGTTPPPPPRLPEFRNARLLSRPVSPSQISRVNGRIRRVTYRYTMLADTPGEIAVPSFDVEIDGETFRTNAQRIVVSNADDQDLLIVEVEFSDPAPYLGERVDVTLRLLIQPYSGDEIGGRLNAESMRSLINPNQSNWGDLAGLRKTRPKTSQARRDGKLYDVSTFTGSWWPDRTGVIELSPISIVMDYPVRLAPSRGFFSRGQWEPVESRTIIGQSTPPPFDVRSPPSAGRPDAYAGAIGRFDYQVSAKPTEVVVGDPITLTMVVRNRSTGEIQLEHIASPPIERMSELTDLFRVPDEPRAGIINAERGMKVFTETIRARKAGTQAIPALPFVSFDPDAEQYVTVRSRPITINVSEAPTMALSDVVGVEPETASPTELTELAGGLMANISDEDALLAAGGFSPHLAFAFVLGVPPVAWALLWFGVHGRRDRDERGLRRRNARRESERRLAAATRDGHVSADAVATALREYVADRVGAAPGSLTSSEVRARLEDDRVGEDVTSAVVELLHACDRSRYAGDRNGLGDAEIEQARRLIGAIERGKRS